MQYPKHPFEDLTQGQINALNQYGAAMSEDNRTGVHVRFQNKIKGAAQKRPRKALLIAAIIGCATLAAAAAFYSVSDAFRGVLKDQGTAGDQAPLSSTAPVVDKTGALLDDTKTVNGIEVSLRGVVGDERGLQVLLDITDHSGSSLALRQADGSLSADELRFRQHDVVPEVMGDSFSVAIGTTVIDFTPGSSQATLLIRLEAFEDSPLGQTFHITLTDIMQFAVLEPVGIGMEPGELYNLVSQYDVPTAADFEATGAQYDSSGAAERYYYLLTKDGAASSPLCATAPWLTIHNAAMWEGDLYLRGTVDSDDHLEQILNGAVLLDQETGEAHPLLNSGKDDSGAWTFAFGGISSVEDLRSLVWVYGYGEQLHPVVEGTWEFALSPQFESVTRSFPFSESVAWDGHSISVSQLEVSPYTLSLAFTADPATTKELFADRSWGELTPPTQWEMESHPLVLVMQDGSNVTAIGPGGSVQIDTAGSGQFHYSYVMDVVIDPQQVTGVLFDDHLLPLE